MIEVHSLDVAGLQFVVKPPEGWRVVEDDPRYTGFLNTPSPEKTDVIDVDLTFDAPSFDGLPLLFDTGDAWRAFRDGDDILIDMAPPEVPGRLWTARLKADRRHISIYCGEPLVAGTAGDRQIRNPVRYPLDQILMLGILPSLGRLVVHGAGASRGGVGLGFPGYSGAGKSTLMSLMKRIPDVFGLSDDRIVLEGAPDRSIIFGTPWAGDERVAGNARAPLKALVFLHHSEENRLVSIDRKAALRQILPTACIPWFDPEGIALGLASCDAIVGSVPAYEIHFRPEVGALAVLDALW